MAAEVPAWELALAVFLPLSARGPPASSANDPAITRIGTIREILNFTTASLIEKWRGLAHRTR
jgi:hypothetical protein